MGDRIIFRERDPGLCIDIDGAISLVEPRVRFLPGWKSVDNGGDGDPGDGSVECGPGTAYPLQVTPAELAEIAYRIRDVRIDASSFIRAEDTGFHDAYSFKVTADAPLARLYSDTTIGLYSDTVIVDRAMVLRQETSIDPTFALPAPFDPLFDDPYDVGGYSFREPLTERAVLAPLENDPVIWQEIYGVPVPFQCGCRHLILSPSYRDEDGAIPATYMTYSLAQVGVGDPSTGPASIQVNFSGEVAIIDHAGNGDPLDPANELWLACDVTIDVESWSSIYLYRVSSRSTDPDYATHRPLDGSTEGLVQFRIQLSGTGRYVEVPLWFHDPGSGLFTHFFENITGDILMTPTKWWSYATSAGSAAWDTTTGAPANGGPAA